MYHSFLLPLHKSCHYIYIYIANYLHLSSQGNRHIWRVMAEFRCWSFWRAVLAEFVGMLLFIVFGLSAIVGNAGSLEVLSQEIKVSLAFALAIATLAQSLGHISGAHLNPAVTLGLLVSCRISILRCICYILAQMLGAIAASAIVNSFASAKSLGVNAVNNLFMNSHLTGWFSLELNTFSCCCLSFAAQQCDCSTRHHHRVLCHPSAGSVCDSSDR